MATDIPQATRKLVYERDGWRCRWCGRSNPGLDLHHIMYRSSGVDHSPENLISLCRTHHELAHSNKHLYQPFLLDLMQRPAVTGLQLMRWQKAANARPPIAGSRLAQKLGH